MLSNAARKSDSKSGHFLFDPPGLSILHKCDLSTVKKNIQVAQIEKNLKKTIDNGQDVWYNKDTESDGLTHRNISERIDLEMLEYTNIDTSERTVEIQKKGTYNVKSRLFDSLVNGEFVVSPVGGREFKGSEIPCFTAVTIEEMRIYTSRDFNGIMVALWVRDEEGGVHCFYGRLSAFFRASPRSFLTETKKGVVKLCFKPVSSTVDDFTRAGVGCGLKHTYYSYETFIAMQEAFDALCIEKLTSAQYEQVCSGFAGYTCEWLSLKCNFSAWQENFQAPKSTKKGANFDYKDGMTRVEVKAGIKSDSKYRYLHHETDGTSKANGFTGNGKLKLTDINPVRYAEACKKAYAYAAEHGIELGKK